MVFRRQIEKGNAFLRPHDVQHDHHPAEGSFEPRLPAQCPAPCRCRLPMILRRRGAGR